MCAGNFLSEKRFGRIIFCQMSFFVCRKIFRFRFGFYFVTNKLQDFLLWVFVWHCLCVCVFDCIFHFYRQNKRAKKHMEKYVRHLNLSRLDCYRVVGLFAFMCKASTNGTARETNERIKLQKPSGEENFIGDFSHHFFTRFFCRNVLFFLRRGLGFCRQTRFQWARNKKHFV